MQLDCIARYHCFYIQKKIALYHAVCIEVYVLGKQHLIGVRDTVDYYQVLLDDNEPVLQTYVLGASIAPPCVVSFAAARFPSMYSTVLTNNPVRSRSPEPSVRPHGRDRCIDAGGWQSPFGCQAPRLRCFQCKSCRVNEKLQTQVWQTQLIQGPRTFGRWTQLSKWETLRQSAYLPIGHALRLMCEATERVLNSWSCGCKAHPSCASAPGRPSCFTVVSLSSLQGKVRVKHQAHTAPARTAQAVKTLESPGLRRPGHL